jgi:hypothetical protein
MTPRELFGWLTLARRRRRAELAELLAVSALGSRGEPGEVKRQLKEWQD